MKTAAPVSKKTTKIVKIVISTVLSAVILFIAVTAVWLLIDKYIIRYPVPRLFGYSFLCVESGSMQDEIMVNDLIVITKTKDYEINDIITYLRDDETVPTTHRIVGKTSDGKYITKGDANNTNDRFPVSEDEILGEVIKIKEGAGSTLIWVRTRGWIYLMGFAILVAIASFLFDTGNDESSDEHNKETVKGDKE